MVNLSAELATNRLQTANSTKRSIGTVSTWILHHTESIRMLADCWLKLFRTESEEHRIVLFYIMNDVVQRAKKKHADIVCSTFEQPVISAVSLARFSEKLRGVMGRCLKLIAECTAFSAAGIEKMNRMISDPNGDADDGNYEIDVHEEASVDEMIRTGVYPVGSSPRDAPTPSAEDDVFSGGDDQDLCEMRPHEAGVIVDDDEPSPTLLQMQRENRERRRLKRIQQIEKKKSELRKKRRRQWRSGATSRALGRQRAVVWRGSHFTLFFSSSFLGHRIQRTAYPPATVARISALIRQLVIPPGFSNQRPWVPAAPAVPLFFPLSLPQPLFSLPPPPPPPPSPAQSLLLYFLPPPPPPILIDEIPLPPLLPPLTFVTTPPPLLPPFIVARHPLIPSSLPLLITPSLVGLPTFIALPAMPPRIDLLVVSPPPTLPLEIFLTILFDTIKSKR